MEEVSAKQLLELNDNVRSLVGSITRWEAVLQDKLTLVSCGLKQCGVLDENDC